MNCSLVVAVAAIALSAGTASAATISFAVDKGWTTGAHSYTNGTESVSVESYLYTKDVLPTLYGNPYLASWSDGGGFSNGLGICNGNLDDSAAGSCADDDYHVDGDEGNEVAVLDFGALIVKLTSITFSHVDRDDRFDVFGFGNGTGAAATESDLTVLLPNDCAICTVSDFFLGQGSIFGIGADSANSEFKIHSISFDVIPAAVPLPAAGWMLAAGLGGLAAVRRKNKAA